MWLLEQSILAKLENALEAGLEQNWLAVAGANDVVHTQAAAQIEDGMAIIPVKGILTKKADPLIAFFFGDNTAYDDINAQLASAESNSKVRAIRFDIDSPGGNTDGLFDTLAAIGTVSKPMSVFARNANSAAYGIAAAAGNITAANPASTFGSIGILAKVSTNDSVHTITSSSAPDKAPDPRTEEGRAAIVRHLDAIEGLFVGAIADGRGTTPDAVKLGFGRGASLLAAEAKQRGMIDGIAGTELRVVQNATKATAAGGSEDGTMNIEQLKAEHPAVFKAAVEIGVRQELDRVEAHLNLGETGCMKTAIEGIKSGDGITQKTYSAHMSAAMNRNDIKARNKDDDQVKDATEHAKTEVDKEDEFQGEVLAHLKRLVGTEGIENG